GSEVIEHKREYDITDMSRFGAEPVVREVREVVAKDIPRMPEGHEGAWGWAQIVRNIAPDSPELAEIAEQVRTLPIKQDVVSRGPVIPQAPGTEQAPR
ncbi:MAG TPA: hypothetical protein VFX84_02955, partial [Candidatus Saccharimonadales bacterium]|nr:hypothetical protein [Candidatus Saccharimonadales bacterium]